MERSLYEVLGVNPSASAEEIEAACIKLGEQFSPERNKGNLTATIRFKEIEQAYETLSDPEKRAAYDRAGSRSDAEPKSASVSIGKKESKFGRYVFGAIVFISVYWYFSDHQGNKTKQADSSTVSSGEKKSLREKLFEVSISDGFLKTRITIEQCKRQSERIAKCIIQSTDSNILDGRKISASAYKFDRSRMDSVKLAPAIVNAAETIGSGPSEITILMPEGTDFVYLSYSY